MATTLEPPARQALEMKELFRRAQTAVAEAFGFDVADTLPEEYTREDDGDGDYLISVSHPTRKAPVGGVDRTDWYDPRPRPAIREWWQVRLDKETGEAGDITHRGYI
jgi:hypothetical protein